VYSYDPMNRLVNIEISQGTEKAITALTYSSSGKLLEISDESGKISFTYDSFGHVTSETGEVGVIKYEYNNRGLLSGKECIFSRKDAEF
jgi:YD repeat-containing protein